MFNLIVGLKIKSYSSFAVVVKIIKEYCNYPFSEIKARIDKNDYLLCFECADRFGVKKVISCYEKLTANNIEAVLYELDNRETTIERMKSRDKMYDGISDEIDTEDEN